MWYTGGRRVARWAKRSRMDTKEDAEVQEQPSSPILVLQHISGALHSMYSGNSNVPPPGLGQGHRRSQSEVVTTAHGRHNSFQRLKSHMQKAWKWGSNSRVEDYQRSFNPEVLANQKRQWYQFHTKSPVFYLNCPFLFYNSLGSYLLWGCENFQLILFRNTNCQTYALEHELLVIYVMVSCVFNRLFATKVVFVHWFIMGLEFDPYHNSAVLIFCMMFSTTDILVSYGRDTGLEL